MSNTSHNSLPLLKNNNNILHNNIKKIILIMKYEILKLNKY